MGYRINVAKLVKRDVNRTYTHLFATDPETLTDAETAAVVLEILLRTFPAPQYDVSISERQLTGKGYEVKQFLKKNLPKDK
jgi:hypothetical protein